MSRTSYTFSVLQAIAAVASLAIIMWSLGLPVLQFAEAANVTTLSNTLSTSEPGVGADHTIYFVTPSGVATGSTITIDFTDGPFDTSAVNFEDIDVQEGEDDFTVAADCTAATGETVGASFAADVLTITFCGTGTADLAPGASTTIEIGLNATAGATGASQIINPIADSDSYQIPITAGSDTGETRVMILDVVTVNATVDTIFTFSVNATPVGTIVGTNPASQVETTPTEINFGELQANTASTAAQQLEVSTNAANGFSVTVQANQQLTSSNGAIIDGYQDGGYAATPVAGGWQSPGGNIALDNTWGHWGLSSDDTTVTGGDIFSGGDDFVSASSSPVEVFYHNGPANGSVSGQGTANVVYQIEITAFQEAADDYTATLTYVATPVF